MYGWKDVFTYVHVCSIEYERALDYIIRVCECMSLCVSVSKHVRRRAAIILEESLLIGTVPIS